MRKTLIFIGMVCVAAALGFGCASTFTEKTSATSAPVQMGAATTNETQAVAWIEAARAVNKAANVTPTSGAVDALLGAAIAAAAAIGGWITRHKTPNEVDSPPPPK